MRVCSLLAIVGAFGLGVGAMAPAAEPTTVDFNRDIRPILFANCIQCHGPDEAERKGGTEGLRLDTRDGAMIDLGGYAAIVPGDAKASALIERVTTTDPDLVMPPKELNKQLSDREKELLKTWIEQGAKYAKHWSYEKPVRGEPPRLDPGSKYAAWPKNEIDRFLLARLEREGLAPSPAADRETLIRRLSLDLTGLPPTLAEIDAFVADNDPQAYEHLVDRLLDKPAYGEHWAYQWLDLARYADSAGYADDPPRTIWLYRDYVIRSLNANKPFDQFTIEQIAGDLLPNPTDEQLIATAFHRNTLTNSEGGTNDEEFRNVAIVDRVSTTLAAWMGTTIACAQCHTHKYDPLTQEEFFKVFAFFNNTEDADRNDEAPLLSVLSDSEKQRKTQLETELAAAEREATTLTPELAAQFEAWQQAMPKQLDWVSPKPIAVSAKSGAAATIGDDGAILVPTSPSKTDSYTIELPASGDKLQALRLEAIPDPSLPGGGSGHGAGNFVLSKAEAIILQQPGAKLQGRYVRVEQLGENQYLHLAEVQVFQGDQNLAPQGTASQVNTAFDGPAKLANDGNTDGNYPAGSVSHTFMAKDPWWEVDLQSEQPLDRVVLWNRTDGGTHTRLNNFRVSVLNEQRQTVWEFASTTTFEKSLDLRVTNARTIRFAAAYADFEQQQFAASYVLQPKTDFGWAVAPQQAEPHQLTLIAEAPVALPPNSRLAVILEQTSKYDHHTLGKFRLSYSADPRAAELAKIPAPLLAVLQTPTDQRTEAQQSTLAKHFLSQAPALAPQRERVSALKKQLAEVKPITVPIQRELAPEARRVTKLQHRGNFMDLGQVLTEGVPAAFHPLPEGAPLNRLTLARWLVDPENPLTARVTANRFWEQIFGIGIVSTSEDFGSQGEAPVHPELLDWLATELVRLKWDQKAFIKLLVTSAAYQQSSKVTPELLARDPDNRLLASGPRVRLSAEMVRDEALAVSGLLSRKMYGPPVKPPQPSSGLSAAFGGSVDWQTSDGEDKHRRGIYTSWRRSNPYPSMAAFDAPNREVCTVRRVRTNTPLQALVTLNDPVYVEAAQALARQVAATEANDTPSRITLACRTTLGRSPNASELDRLTKLYDAALADFQAEPAEATKMAAEPLGPLPSGASATELAAWTVVGNVLLNLDEMFMKR